MIGEPWYTLLLVLLFLVGIVGGAFVQDWLADRAAARRARDASAHSAE